MYIVFDTKIEKDPFISNLLVLIHIYFDVNVAHKTQFVENYIFLVQQEEENNTLKIKLSLFLKWIYAELIQKSWDHYFEKK